MFDRFRNASQARQIQLIVAGACVIALLLAAVWFFLLRTVYQPLFGDLRPADAVTIVSALERKKIPYRLADGGRVILVPEDIVDSTRLSVMTDDLPLKGTVGFELFNKSDMGLTDFAQKINYQRALQGELERTIMTLDGVEAARVHLSLGEDRLFRDDRVPPKASVTVRMARRGVLSQAAAQGVKRLVAAAVPNLDSADVVILDEQGQVVNGPAPAPAAATLISPLSQEKAAIEAYYAGRIRIALEHANLPAGIDVAVEAGARPGTGGGDLESLVSSWTPGARAFPLSVTLAPATVLDAAAEQSARIAAASAIASNPPQDDVIAFGAVTAPVVPPMPSAPVLRRPAQIAPAADPLVAGDDHSVLLEAGLAFAFVAAIVLGFLLLLGRLRRAGRLDERRRLEFAAKLRTALAEREGHVTARS